MGTRIAVMKDGFLQQVDTPQNLYDKPSNIFVGGFIGSPSMNFFDVKVKGSPDNIQVEGEGFQLDIPPERAAGLKSKIGQTVVMGIRPEDLHDANFVPPNIHSGLIDAQVDVTELMGNEVYLHLITGKQAFVARVDPRTKAHIGGRTQLAANLDNVHFFDKETEKALR